MKPYGHLGKVGCYCCHGNEILPSRFNLGQPHSHGGGRRAKSRRPAKRRARREAKYLILQAISGE